MAKSCVYARIPTDFFERDSYEAIYHKASCQKICDVAGGKKHAHSGNGFAVHTFGSTYQLMSGRKQGVHNDA